MIKAYIDASTKGNPGPSGAGLLIVTDNGQEQKALPLPILTNHQAEFAAFQALLELLMAEKRNHETIFVYSDSKVLVQTIDKNHTNNPDFLPFLQEIQHLLPHFQMLILQWLPESKNKGADNLARQGLQKALKKQS